MKKLLLGMALALATAPLALSAADDPLAGWSEAQLKVKVMQLMNENKELKAKLASGGAVAAAPAAKASSALLIDDFEGDMSKVGTGWWNGFDDNKLGTKLEPATYAPAAGGKNGKCNRIYGHLGSNREPWPWASTGLKLADPNISGYGKLTFWAKGDGGTHKVQLQRSAVKDFAHYSASFTAPKAWTKVELPLSGFAQPDTWGEKIPVAWTDVEGIQFMPGTNDADFDFSIDDLTLEP